MKNLLQDIFLDMFTAFKKFFLENHWYMFTTFLYFPRTYLFRRKMSENERIFREPKRDGGCTRITNNSEGLSEDLIIEKKLRTPEGLVEDDRTRENRLQEIRRLQALRWYEY